MALTPAMQIVGEWLWRWRRSRPEAGTEHEQSGVGSNDQTGDSDRIPPEKTDSAPETPSADLTEAGASKPRNASIT